jgi:general L-amino acid transport system substrate-binding protein
VRPINHRGPRALAMFGAAALTLIACSDTSDTAGTESTEPTVVGETTAAEVEVIETTSAPADGESVLDTVIANDVVRCGTRDDLPGFATLDAAGERVGFDSDFCRVIAAAVLGDATKVEFVDLETEARFTALQSGEIDVLVRNTTWTASRDGIEGATFLQPTFYDGQGMMVAADAGYASLDDMDGAVVCVAGGTTSEGNVAAEFARRGLTAQVQSFDDVTLLQEAFVAGRCDGWSSDTSQLTGLRSNYPGGPDTLVILDEVFSKEPLAPAVADGDSRWAQAVDWAIYATVQAEELGITQANATEQAASTDPNVQRFLGGVNADGTTLDVGLGLPADANLQVVTQVGNYGEIFDRHLAPLGLERGLNALWNDGGLMYAPPFR